MMLPVFPESFKEWYTMKKFIAMTAASAMLLTCFAACGKSKDKSTDFTGMWAGSEMTSKGQTMTSMNLLFINVPLDAMLHVEIKDNGDFLVSTGLVGMDDDEADGNTAAKGKWEKVDDDTIKVTGLAGNKEEEEGEFDEFFPDGLEINFDGDSFSFDAEEEGEKVNMKFKRVTEFTTYDASAAMQGLADAFSSSNDDDE